MYVVIYSYKVLSNMRKRFLELMRKTANLCTKYGCLEYEAFEDAQHKGDWLNKPLSKQGALSESSCRGGQRPLNRNSLARILLHNRSQEGTIYQKRVRIVNEGLKNEPWNPQSAAIRCFFGKISLGSLKTSRSQFMK